MRRKLLQHHYGLGTRICPAAGKKAPEMAAGRLHEVLKFAWDEFNTELLFGDLGCMYPLARDQMEFFKAEISRAYTSLETIMVVKCSYWSRLPWLLCALALVDEDEARVFAGRIIEAFNQDPRPPPVHHQITWNLMRPGSPFRIELELFHAGKPRLQCSDYFLFWIAVFRFLPIVETTIEEKHSRASLAAKAHHLGLTRISLSNRLPLLERLLAREPGKLDAFLHCFEATRKLTQVPSGFGFEAHLSFSSRPAPPFWKYPKLLADVMYHKSVCFNEFCFFYSGCCLCRQTFELHCLEV